MSAPAASSGPEAALADLGRAISRAADALSAMPDDDAIAYRAARALDAAFGELTELLRSVPRIVGLAEPGRVVSERLEQRGSELATRRAEAAGYRARLDELRESEQSLAEVTAEAEGLREHLTELERATRLASEIPGLRARAADLEEAVAAAGAADAPEIGARIAAAASHLAALSASQRQALSTTADSLAAAAEKAAAELAEQRTRHDDTAAELAQRESDAAQLAADYDEKLPVLTAWRQADADVADGLRTAGFGAGPEVGGPLPTVAAELEAIRQRLTGLDGTLRTLLTDQAAAYEQARQRRSL